MKRSHVLVVFAATGLAVSVCLFALLGADESSRNPSLQHASRTTATQATSERQPSEQAKSTNGSKAPHAAAAAAPAIQIHDLGSEFDRLAEAVSHGDVESARALLKATQECVRGPSDRSELEKVAKQLNDPKSAYAALGDAQKKIVLEDSTRTFNLCKNVTKAQLNRSPEWALLLAESGDSEAKVNYTMLGKPRDLSAPDVQEADQEFMARAKRYLNEEIDRGNADALMTMAVGYMPPVFSDNATPFVVDPYEAYKYYYAFGMTESGQAAYASTVAGNLAQLEEKLQQDQVNAARQEGLAIYESCCKK